MNASLKNYVVLLALVVLAVAGLGKQLVDKEDQTPGEPDLNAAPRVDSPAPYFILENLEGNKVSLSDFAGKNVLLVFWATYCGWCAEEKEDLKRFTEENRGRIEVVAVDNESRQTLLDYVSKEKINFMILLDENRATFEKYQVLGTPAHFLINEKGKIVARRPGYASHSDLLMLAQALEEE